jgi:hypothetical protein
MNLLLQYLGFDPSQLGKMNPTNSYSFCQSLGIDTANIRIIPQFLRQDYYSNTALRGALDDIRPNKSFLGFHPHGRLAKTEDL